MEENEMIESATRYAKIYSEHGIIEMIDRDKAKIVEKEKDKTNVGTSWMPAQITSHVKTLEEDITQLNEQIQTLQLALIFKIGESEKRIKRMRYFRDGLIELQRTLMGLQHDYDEATFGEQRFIDDLGYVEVTLKDDLANMINKLEVFYTAPFPVTYK